MAMLHATLLLIWLMLLVATGISEDEDNRYSLLSSYVPCSSCKTKPCQCVLYYLCENGTIVEDGRRLLNPRNTPISELHCEESEECCHVPDSPNMRTDECLYFRQRKEGYDPWLLEIFALDELKEENKVGYEIYSNEVLEDENKDEYESDVKQIPYQCSAVLINPKVALTSELCHEYISDSVQAFARGMYDTDKENYVNITDKVSVGNLSLIFLSNSIDHIGVACLPEFNTAFLWENCLVMGRNIIDSNNTIEQCDEDDVERCEERFITVELTNNHTSLNTKQDACKADNGGPLMCPMVDNPRVLVVAGIVSSVTPNCNNWNSTFTVNAVTPHLTEIKKHITDKQQEVHKQAVSSEAPWMLALFRKYHNSTREFLCGATLISNQVALTAAHCLDGFTNDEYKLEVVAGVTNIDHQNINNYPHQTVEVFRQVRHIDYDSQNLANDIALLKLKEPLKLKFNVHIVNLPSEFSTFTDKHCFVTGWGHPEVDENIYHQSILRKVSVPILDQETCQDKIGRVYELWSMDEGLLCAGGINDDICQGDSGGPLVCSFANGTQLEQVGIVSWGVSCKNGLPGVYTNIKHYKQWITKKLSQYPFKS